MARLGLGDHWECIFANDACTKKVTAYRNAFGASPELLQYDIRRLNPDQLPNGATLAWASFPCQDLSLAGKGRGLQGNRSSTFWAFLDLIIAKNQVSKVPILAIENVVGALTSNGGKDIEAIFKALAKGGYRFGALVIDAKIFLPQSRPRLFIVAVSDDMAIPQRLITENPCDAWHKPALIHAYGQLSQEWCNSAIWWRLPFPSEPAPTLVDLLEQNHNEVKWHTKFETDKLLEMMSASNIEKVKEAQFFGKYTVGTLYKRTRLDESGNKCQRAEVRFDQISGCLRTPAGGSSRQIILIVEGPAIRSRLLTPREAARLMGVPDTYILPKNYNEAYHLMGDGVAVPVVSWLREHLLNPLAQAVLKIHKQKVA